MKFEHTGARTSVEERGGVYFRYELLPARRMSYVSARIFEWSAYRPADFLADPALFFDMVHPDDRQAFLRSLRGADANDGTAHIRWTRKDGSSYPVEQRVFLILDSSGTAIALEGTADLAGTAAT